MENDSNEKFFEIIDNTRHLTELTSANIISYRDIKSLMQVGNSFTEGELNLIEFIVGPDYLMSNKNISPLDVLSDSKSTLKQLVIADNMRTHGKNLFDFVLQCRNLEELTIDVVIPRGQFPYASPPDPITLITIPEGLERDKSMKRLCLRASKHVFDWKGLIKWMGKGLESLYLEGFDQWSDQRDLYLLRDINDYISLLETYRGSLKSIEFHRLACQVNSISNPSIKNLTSFPNLEYLSFYDVDNSIYKPFISNISFPKLHTLVFTTFKTNQESFNCLVWIIKSCSTTLKALQYNHYRSKAPKLPLASEQEELLNLGLEFPVLETISFGRSNEEVGRWFSGLSKGFPKLTQLRSTDRLRRYFLVKSPELPQTQDHAPDWLEDGIDESEGHFVFAE